MHCEQKLQNSCNTVFPRNMMCFEYISVNTQHKADNNNNIPWSRVFPVKPTGHQSV